MGTNNTQFHRRFCAWRRKVRERNSEFSLRSMELGWSSSVGPRIKVGVLGEGYVWIPEPSSFSKVSRRRFGESKASREQYHTRTQKNVMNSYYV